MEYSTPKSLGFPLPRLGFGTMRLPLLDRADEASIDQEQVNEMVDRAMAAGVNYFDTAYLYHKSQSEQSIGKALSRYPREQFLLVDKMPVWACKSQDDVSRIFEEQLRRCQVEYFDLYLIHAMNRDTLKSVEQLSIYEFLAEQKRQGRIRALGFSFHDSPEFFDELLERYEFDVVQVQLNYLDWELQNAKRLYETVEKKGVACIVMEPLRGGLLARLPGSVHKLLAPLVPDLTNAQLGLRWLCEKPALTTILSGMSSIRQLEENISTLSNPAPLSKTEREAVQIAAAALSEIIAVPCTACGYCMDCPFGVDIPAAFSALNGATLSKNSGMLTQYLAATKSGPALCTACGACSSRCPQHIDIPKALAQMAKAEQ